MRLSRLFVPLPLSGGARLSLDTESAHYLRSVLRLRQGAELLVFNGEGGEYPAKIVEIDRDRISLALGNLDTSERESALITHIGLGISRSERMDLAIQKAVELGATTLTPLFTDRCVVHLDEDKKLQRHKHWEGVARSACEQCGRNRLPRVHQPTSLEAWTAGLRGLGLILHPRGGVSLRDLPPTCGEVTILSGPEGGFSDRECRLATAAGFTALRLGPRTLRTETAALAALAAVQTLWGDFGAQ